MRIYIVYEQAIFPLHCKVFTDRLLAEQYLHDLTVPGWYIISKEITEPANA